MKFECIGSTIQAGKDRPFPKGSILINCRINCDFKIFKDNAPLIGDLEDIYTAEWISVFGECKEITACTFQEAES